MTLLLLVQYSELIAKRVCSHPLPSLSVCSAAGRTFGILHWVLVSDIALDNGTGRQ